MGAGVGVGVDVGVNIIREDNGRGKLKKTLVNKRIDVAIVRITNVHPSNNGKTVDLCEVRAKLEKTTRTVIKPNIKMIPKTATLARIANQAVDNSHRCSNASHA